ncbi:MAG: hypothetical protein HY721_22765 [Planctomycetes bacterium]|nr:hypothetical protein [Planctomycetota bacterium]
MTSLDPRITGCAWPGASVAAPAVAIALGVLVGGLPGHASGQGQPAVQALAENGHPWRPPFGLDRIGQPLAADHEAAPPFEAEAIARPDAVIHPVDLGTILPPAGWLLLAGGQTGSLEAAAISRAEPVPDAKLVAWFASAPGAKTSADMPLEKGRRAQASLRLPPAPAAGDCDVLHVSIARTDGKALWSKEIPTMILRRPPRWPRFGARRMKLRYDAPISLRADDGTWSSMKYEDGWAPELDDVVVCLPNGARFVFWRGSSYIPFWAGRSNTELCYEWAETSPPKDGYQDCVEPLMDKECRYSRVTIVESTPARVHVRWSY